MSLLDTLNTKITGPGGASGTDTSVNGVASVDQPETIDGLALDTLASGTVDLAPTVQSGAGGSGYSWLGGQNGYVGGAGGAAGAGILTLSNDSIGSNSTYDPNAFTYYSTAEGGYAGNGGVGANLLGGNGGKGGDATNIVTNLSAFLAYTSVNNGSDMTLKALAGPGGGGSYGGSSAGSGGGGGAGGNAATSISASTIVVSDAIFGISASATGGAGAAAGPGGGYSGSGAGSGGNGGRGGDATVSMIGDSVSVAGNLSVYLLARTGLGGAGGAAGAGGLAGASGAAGAARLDIENTTLSVAAEKGDALTFALAEIQGPSTPLTLNGGDGGNLVFSGNHFVGSGTSELDLSVANGGVAVDTVAGTIAINGSSASNTLSGFDIYRLDSNDSIVMSAGIQVYLSTDPDTVILEAGHVGGTVYNATSTDFVIEFKGFTGLTLAQIQQDTRMVNASTTQITISGQTLTLAGYSGPIDATNTQIVPCFVRGTRISTIRGEIPGESLAVGDIVLTASGRERAIRWIGRRAVDCARHLDPVEVWPICVSAGAFGDNQPARDLWLSPGHSVVAEGVLIPIKLLQNGRSVTQHEWPSVEYWHIELDQHDILVADGLPAESYLDTGNRTGFVNGGDFIEAHPDFKPRYWAQTCLPLVLEGPPIALTKAKLIARLQGTGCALTQACDLHVVADGERFEPIELRPMRYAFALTPGRKDIKLMSRRFTPAHTLPDSNDTRSLGLCVGRLQIDGEPIALDDDAHCRDGWHEREPGWRWTRGCASLPADTRVVVIDLSGEGSYWEEPEEIAAQATVKPRDLTSIAPLSA